MHMLNNHECKEARFKQDCPICLSDMHNSIRSASILRCGHSIHLKCLKEYSKNNIACPICKKSLFDITQHEEFYDVQMQAVTMPSEYANTWMKMLCNDCLHVSEIKFHFLGGKCDRCKSYNTT
jgi:RING finger/CHY zinc finger protein 1